MIVYALHCTLCHTDYSTVLDWNEHLINSSHQNKSKTELCEWDKSVRKCCVVIYSRTNLAKNVVKSVIPFIMASLTNGVSVIVTDLILSCERPGIGIIRFESREKVDQLFSILTSSSIQIDNQLFQFRHLGTFLQLEWEELLVSSFNIELPNSDAQQEEDNPLINQPTKPADFEGSFDIQTEDQISSQVNSILKQMEIPDEEFNFAEKVIQEVKESLEGTLHQKCIVTMYRNNYLELRNSLKPNRYLIFMYKAYQRSLGFAAIGQKTKDQIFQTKPGPDKKSVFQKLGLEGADSGNKSEMMFVHPNLAIEFVFSNFLPLMASLQLSKLISYYCRFDVRVKPLLSLVYFWAKINGIQLVSDKVRGQRVHSHEVDPVALEWLLLFFLFYKEQALPVPRTILERPHQTIMFSKVDLGFNEDLKVASAWESERRKGYPPLESTESAKNLLLVFKKFLKFCSQGLGTGRHILNVRDGEILSSEGPSKPFLLSRMGKHEIKDEKFGNHLSEPEKEYISELVKSDLNNMIVLSNPFDIKWRLIITYDNWFNVACPAMQKTAEKLEKFLKSGDSCNISNHSVESVLSCQLTK